MKPVLFVDLDRTIFDTVGFFTLIEDILKNNFNVSDTDYEKIRSLYAVQSADPMLRYSDFDEILVRLGISKEEFQKVVINAAGKNKYILPDAVHFIEWLLNCKTHEIRILSFGQYYFQMLKLRVTPAIKSIPEHIIMTRKNEFIAKEYSNRIGILIDDKPNQELPNGWKEIYIDRARNVNSSYNESNSMIRITTLADAPKYIHSAHM
jgi:hypothetical protein